ncbi:MAG: hypothetical protein JO288_11040, partial [Hyphomicrobiales bacterium]|nr:hypothetical protein [Hyphomicrobiales bacterium]
MPRDKRSSSDDGMADAERGALPDDPMPGDDPTPEDGPMPGDDPMSEDELMPRVKRSSLDDGMADAERGAPPDGPAPEPPRDGLRLSSSDPELPG